MKKIIIALTGILALPVVAQTTAAAPTATVPAATTTITTVPLRAGTETTTTTTTVINPQQAMEEAPAIEEAPVTEELIAPALPQRQERSPDFNLSPEEEEDEYVPGSNFLNFEEKDDDEL